MTSVLKFNPKLFETKDIFFLNTVNVNYIPVPVRKKLVLLAETRGEAEIFEL
jgi:hypothetical protein